MRPGPQDSGTRILDPEVGQRRKSGTYSVDRPQILALYLREDGSMDVQLQGCKEMNGSFGNVELGIRSHDSTVSRSTAGTVRFSTDLSRSASCAGR
jgi:hypothetical protein